MSDQDILCGDCLDYLRQLPDNSVDLVFCSPPYDDARTYGIDFALRGQEWVDWCVPRYLECVRVCKGLVAWVVEGRTHKFRYTATPILLMADLHRAGVNLRKPAAYVRHGIPGSGGPDWLKNRYEYVVCSTKGKLPWSDNTAMGHTPRHGPGGAMSNRTKDGSRVVKTSTRRGNVEGERRSDSYKAPDKANPGNWIEFPDDGIGIDCGSGGGGNIGAAIAHENEAPFPEMLAEFFIRSFCPPSGCVLDPFSGSGTTAAMAKKWGRDAIAIDIRQDQCDLIARRLEQQSVHDEVTK